MHDLIVEFEQHVRLSAFLGVFVLVALWEITAPRRPLQASKVVRWTSNIGLEQFRDPRRQWLWHMLALPFTGSGGGYSRGWRRGD